MKRQIEEAIRTAISRTDNHADLEWVRRHFIHHNKASYLVIPNLYSADTSDPQRGDEPQRALAMNQLAGVLADLDLVRWPASGWPKKWPKHLWRPKKSELEKLKQEETLPSDTDLTDIRKWWIKEKKARNAPLTADDEEFEKASPLRNHGLFSKAERALSLAGWSKDARRDVEIFRIVDVDGLTPLLMVLNEVPAKAAASASEPTPPSSGPGYGGTLKDVTPMIDHEPKA